MPNHAKKVPTPPNFEDAMKRLEEIVEKMEAGDLPLEDLIVRYEEGMNLVKVCQERLTTAEERIEMITHNSAGKAIVTDFAPAPIPPASTPAVLAEKGEPKKDVDVSLF